MKTALLPAFAVLLQAPAPERKPPMKTAQGEFDVELSPLETGHKVEPERMGRLAGDKVYRGDLEGTGVVELLFGGDPKSGSAAIVGIEKVTGKLHGRAGTFLLHHRGVMERGKQEYSIGIVPDSGTGELAGISGTVSIRIDGKKHFYALEYAIR